MSGRTFRSTTYIVLILYVVSPLSYFRTQENCIHVRTSVNFCIELLSLTKITNNGRVGGLTIRILYGKTRDPQGRKINSRSFRSLKDCDHIDWCIPGRCQFPRLHQISCLVGSSSMSHSSAKATTERRGGDN